MDMYGLPKMMGRSLFVAQVASHTDRVQGRACSELEITMDAPGPGKSGGCKKMKTKPDENSSVTQAFRAFQVELDLRHDKHERIVKLSRDITVESKRIIFLLQRYVGTEDQDRLLKQAKEKLTVLQQTKFLQLAEELHDEDHFQFLRAYSPGLQEYIEAVAFHHYLAHRQLVSLAAVQADLKYLLPSDAVCTTSCPTVESSDIKFPLTSSASDPHASDSSPATLTADSTARMTNSSATGATESASASSITGAASKRKTSITDDGPSEEYDNQGDLSIPSHLSSPDKTMSLKQTAGTQKPLMVTVPLLDFILGIADLTGELMRSAIMSVSEGDLNFPVAVCSFMHLINTAFVSFGNVSWELNRKLTVLHQSLEKVENACCTLRVRGSEIPKHMLASVFSGPAREGHIVDEDGCFD